MNTKEAIELLRNGVDIAITDQNIFRANDINYNEGIKIKAIFAQNMTNDEIRKEIATNKRLQGLYNE